MLRGRRRRPFLPGRAQEIVLPLGSVSNVGAEGNLVHFETADRATVRCRTRDAAAAQELVRQLPAAQSARFSKEQAERTQFNAGLTEVSPRAVVTPLLIAVNVCVFVAAALHGAGVGQSDPAVMIRWGSNFGPYTLDGQPWRLLTSMFLHFGLAHLALNMLGLWSLGNLTERLFGWASFLTIYLGAGLCGSLLSLYWHPLTNSAGASGAIFGVLGALLVFMISPRTGVAPHIAAPQRNSALLFIAVNLLNGFTHAGIDNAAHIGGLLGGMLLGWMLALPLTREARADAPRLRALVILGSGAALTACAWWLLTAPGLTHEERAFRQQFLQFEREEPALAEEFSRLGRLAQAGIVGDAEFGRRLATSLLPPWQRAVDSFDATRLPPASALAPLQENTLEYVQGQRLALELASEAALHQDRDKLEWALDLLHKGLARRQELQRMSRQLY